MNTDMNPEDVNPNTTDPDKAAGFSYATMRTDDGRTMRLIVPRGFGDSDTMAELPIARDLEDAVNPNTTDPDKPAGFSYTTMRTDDGRTMRLIVPRGFGDSDTMAELPIARDLEDAAAPDPNAAEDGEQAPKRPSGLKRKLVAGGVALAIVAALGVGLSLNNEAVNIPDDAPVASIAGSKDSKTYPAFVTLDADGWGEGDGEFSYEVVDADGESAAKGDIVPGREASVDLPRGAYALNVTSIPTAKDGKTTWLVPDAVDFVVEGKGASVKVSLTKVDMTDDAAVDAAIEKLPEREQAAARKLIEAKRENPNASAVGTPVSRSGDSAVQQAAASNKGDSKPASKPGNSGNSGSGSDSGSSGSTKPSEPEKVWAVVTPAWDEQIYHPAVTHVEKQKVGVQYMAFDGTLFDDEDSCVDYDYDNGRMDYSVLPKYQDVTVTDQEAWTETVHHEAVYGWVDK